MDRWKRKEVIKTIAGYVLALSLLSLAAVESLRKNVSNLTNLSRNMQYFQLFLKLL